MTTSAPASRSAAAHLVVFSRKNGSCVPATRYVRGIRLGITSVGSGSLMIVLLLFAYPALAAGQLVGTDLAQAVPLTAAAALGALAFGHVQFGLTFAVVLGSVPAAELIAA